METAHFLSRILVVAGGVNWLTASIFERDGLGWIFERLGVSIIARIVYALVGFAALFLLVSRDYYLPFLGSTALPSALLGTVREPGSDATLSVRVRVSAPAGSKVVYWASEPASGVVATPKLAYKDGKNSGVAVVDSAGGATLRVRPPSEYMVGMGRRVQRHIHYRVASLTSGLLGRVQTVFV